MKTKKCNVLVRIVVCAAVILILGTVLVSALWGDGWAISVGDPGQPMNGAISIPSDSVEKLRIEWVSGHVRLQTTQDKSRDIRITVDADEVRPAYWAVEGKTLILRYSRTTLGISAPVEPDKDLTIVVPAFWQCRELELITVSGAVEVTGLHATEIDVGNVSAKCTFTACRSNTVSLETVSGDLRFEGCVSELECETVSADCTVQLEENADRLTMEAVSGDLIVYIPEGCGFTADLDSVSGRVHTEHQASCHDGRYICGDGHCRIDVGSVSGNIEIRATEGQ